MADLENSRKFKKQNLRKARKNFVRIGSQGMLAYRYEHLWVPDEADEIYTSKEILDAAEVVKQWHINMALEIARRITNKCNSQN